MSIAIERLEKGQRVDVKIAHCHYPAIVVDVDRLGYQVKLGWEPTDIAYGDESWWSYNDIQVEPR